MSTPWALAISALVVAASAFFVAVEFALVAARKHRLEAAAHTSRSARAALAGAGELSLLLAGSQLGITLCTLALGAISKPTVHHLVEPWLGRSGLPGAGALNFLLALLVVTFVHLVVGEMAPKSWAIAHPERSAILLALPMRAWMRLTRPLLVALNALANTCLRRLGVQPVDELADGRNPADLRELVDHSARAGVLDVERRDRLAAALTLHDTPLREAARPLDELSSVAPDAGAAAIREAARESGHLRLVVRGERGFVHVRDALTGHGTARDLMRPLPSYEGSMSVHAALTAMRDDRQHLALVAEDGEPVGLVALNDLVARLV